MASRPVVILLARVNGLGPLRLQGEVARLSEQETALKLQVDQERRDGEERTQTLTNEVRGQWM